MNDILKWSAKTIAIAVFWVFFLSIHISGRPVFFYAHEIIVENEVVQSLDEDLGNFLERVYVTAREVWDKKDYSASDF